MANHSFNITLADRYGIEGSILIEHLYWWIHKNECEEEETMTKNGRVWCYSSAKGFNRYIPYMTPKKIWRELKRLEERGVLITGNFNTKPTNQTLWYSFSDEFQKEMVSLGYDFPKMENAISKNGKSNNIINNNNLIENNIIENKKRLSNDNQKMPDELFISFWEKYGYKRGKKDAVDAWKKLSKQDKEDAIEAISVYKEDCRICERQMRQPSVYLNKRTWEDDFTNNGKLSKEEPTEETAVIYPEGMTIEKWTEISLWMSSTVSYIAGRITPVQFDDMLRTCGDSVTLANMLTEINAWAEFHRDDDVYEEFKRRIKDSEL
jgi:hypothetical protein